MKNNLSVRAKDPGFWRELLHQARLVYALVRDPEVPIYLKFIPFLGFVYLIFPFDFIPDIAIGLGQLDDLTVILIGSKIFIELAPIHIVEKHRQEIREKDGFLPVSKEEVHDQIVIDGDHDILSDN